MAIKTQIFTNNYNNASPIVKLRYQLLVAKAFQKAGASYIYYNSVNGYVWALANNAFSSTKHAAVIGLAWEENVKVADIKKDAHNHYYIESIHERIAGIKEQIEYSKQFI